MSDTYAPFINRRLLIAEFLSLNVHYLIIILSETTRRVSMHVNNKYYQTSSAVSHM